MWGVGGYPHKNSVSQLSVRGGQGLWVSEASQLTCAIRVMLTGWSSTPGCSVGGGSLLLGGPFGVWAFHAQGSDERAEDLLLFTYRAIRCQSRAAQGESLKVCWGWNGNEGATSRGKAQL